MSAKSSISSVRVRESGAPGDTALTPRQTQVLTLIAEGRTTRQIAGDLGISFKTAAAHRGNLMQKLDIHDTAHLVRHAIRAGVVEP